MKKYQVIKATTKELSGLTVGGREKKFERNGSFETTDAGEAKEIDKVLGAKGTGEVVVTPYEDNEPGHRYKFSGIDIKLRGGNERVKVRTSGGFTYISRAVAEEEGLEIISKRKRKARKSAEVHNVN